MELKAVRIEPSPESRGRVRLAGEIAYDDRPGRVEECWFDFPAAYRDSVSSSGNGWLAVLLPLAATLGEPLRIGREVDRLLYRNVRELLAIWKTWYPALHPVRVEADCTDDGPAGTSTGAFFSGGVDSFFTVLRNDIPEAGAFPAAELICVGGFDIPLRNGEAFRRHASRMAAAADRLGKRFIDVVTNLRETRLDTAGWFGLLHGAALIGTGLMLEGRYARLLIASSNDYGLDSPLGSHFLTDPLLSTSRTRVLHDGAGFRRCSKVELVSRSPVAMESLHVCWRTEADDNCCACEKCFRTMAILEVVGRLEDCTAFSKRRIDASQMSRVFMSRPGLQRYWEEIRVLAESHGRSDLVRAVDRSIRRSRLIRPILALSKWLRGRRLVWRASGILRRRLLRGLFR